MKVDIWSDIACPFCYLGKVQFDRALGSFAHKDDVEVTYHSFELDPEAPHDYDGDMFDMLARKKGMPKSQVEQMVGSIVEQAAAHDLTYNMRDAVITNTRSAHRLVHFAREHGKQSEMLESLYKAYFTDGKHVGDYETLANLAANLGLNRGAALDALTTERFTTEVTQDIAQASSYGITGVPFFIINQKYGLSGAQGEATFGEALQKIWHEEHPLQMVGSSDAAICADNVCL